jgi:saccharopine dehydrogenase-like NADP-dependent oxidoreductase
VKQILVLGAGRSASYLIHHLVGKAEAEDWFVTVGDINLEAAQRQVADHPRGSAIRFDVNDSALRARQIEKADIVLNFLLPAFQELVAWDCVNHGRHMLSASYRTAAIRDLDNDANRNGVLLLSELGLDPGLDHMSAMRLIHDIHERGGKIKSFCSYGSGIPAPEQEQNPLRYAITWNPRNVVMSAQDGAQYMEDGKIKIVPHQHVFHHTWRVDVAGIGELEAYPNRDSLSYMESFGLSDVETMIRGTLRYPGWSETWAQVVALGLPNETMRIPHMNERSYREIIEMFLPMNVTGAKIEQRVAQFLGISRTGKIMDNLRWLGLFSDEKVRGDGDTAMAMMSNLLMEKLRLEDDQRDMVVLVHELEVDYEDGRRELVKATLVERGTPGGITAMSKAVGMPVAVASRLILNGEITLTGSYIPTHPSIYMPVLRETEAEGLHFVEETSALA